jgi:integrase
MDSRLRVRRKAERFTFKFGSTEITIPYQEYRSGKIRYFMIFYYDGGVRRRESRATKELAKERAGQIALNLLNGQTAMSQFSEADRAENLAARNSLAACGQSLVTATAEHARREKILSDKQITFDALLTFWDENRPRITTPQPLPRVVEEYLAGKLGQISKDHYGHRSNQLQKLAAYYTGPIHALQRVDVNTWLGGLGVGPITRRGYRDATRELIRYAEECGYVGTDNPLLKKTKTPRRPTGDTKILTPEEMTILLTARQHAEEHGRARKTMLPFLALAAFAGLRHSEILRLDWREVDIPGRNIYIQKAVSKTGQDRNVPISNNLAGWLQPYSRPNGPVCPILQTSGALTKAKRAAGIPAGENETHNVLRHSYISYRKALVKNIAQVADEAGNSPGIIRKHYLKIIPESEAQRWFAIQDPQAMLRGICDPGATKVS